MLFLQLSRSPDFNYIANSHEISNSPAFFALACFTISAACLADNPHANWTAAERQTRDDLLSIFDRANKAFGDERGKLFREFLDRSSEFSATHPDAVNLWVDRAQAAIEVDYPGAGFLAGKHLSSPALNVTDNAKAAQVMADLQTKGWLAQERIWRDWTNWSTPQVQSAANNGDIEAMDALGNWYAKAMCGLPKDDAQSISWYRMAAEHGNASAQNTLGFCYDNGVGVAKDPAEALKWFLKSAQQGNAEAQNNVGKLYDAGSGVEKNQTEAVNWFRRAADQAYAPGEFNLGVMYAHGTGIAQDDAKAFELYRKSAEQGFPSAEYNLAFMYENGRGVQADLSSALAWYGKARMMDLNLRKMRSNGSATSFFSGCSCGG